MTILQDKTLVVYQVGVACDGKDAVSLPDFKRQLSPKGVFELFGRFSAARFLTSDLGTQSRLLQLAIVLRLASRGTCCLVDEFSEIEVDARWILRRAGHYLLNMLAIYPRIAYELLRLRSFQRNSEKVKIRHVSGSKVAYVRSDPSRGHLMGGSVAHMSGVINGMMELGLQPRLFASMSLPVVSDLVPVNTIRLDPQAYDHLELPYLVFSQQLEEVLGEWVGSEPDCFIYQRYSLHSACGAAVANKHGVPLVVEFNGSEVWINQHWGQGLRFRRLANAIEEANLRCADLIVCVSTVDARMLISRGVASDRILVNPNGVDTRTFNPHVRGDDVRSKLDLADKFVYLFSGSFGPWHGVCELVEAFLQMLAREHVGNCVLILVGDGATRQDAERIVKASGSQGVVFVGAVEPLEVPKYLSAADVLVAPHVPNPDGSEFFGSPIKIFEYLAMGKPIVASRLGQIGEVLTHERNALLFEPGNRDDLVSAMERAFIEDLLRQSLAETARTDSERYSWTNHTRRIIEALRERIIETEVSR